MQQQRIVELLAGLPPAEFRLAKNLNAASLTSFSLGGAVETLVEPQSLNILCQVLALCAEHNIPWRVLGAGTNVIIRDEGVGGLVIRLPKAFSGFCLAAPGQAAVDNLADYFLRQTNQLPPSVEQSSGKDVLLLAFGSAALMGLSRNCAAAGLSGLEFASGIPGSTGAAAVINAGAHGSSMAEVVQRVFFVNGSGALQVRHREELDYGYRRSSFCREHSLVVAVELLLQLRPAAEVKEKRKLFLAARRKSQPLEFPSAGSVFKNPSPEAWKKSKMSLGELSGRMPSAAALIEAVGLKGKQCGGVGFSTLHANWLVKVAADARAGDALELIAEAQQKVGAAFGIALETEVFVW